MLLIFIKLLILVGEVCTIAVSHCYSRCSCSSCCNCTSLSLFDSCHSCSSFFMQLEFTRYFPRSYQSLSFHTFQAIEALAAVSVETVHVPVISWLTCLVIVLPEAFLLFFKLKKLKLLIRFKF